MERVAVIAGKVFANSALSAVVMAIGFIGLSIGLGFYSNYVLPLNLDTSAGYLNEPGRHLDYLSDWDGPHYLQIAQQGYSGSL
ncbi:MAG: hypothetical protein ACREGF_07845 [Candidatus Saccharimonadales bacterium]